MIGAAGTRWAASPSCAASCSWPAVRNAAVSWSSPASSFPDEAMEAYTIFWPARCTGESINGRCALAPAAAGEALVETIDNAAGVFISAAASSSSTSCSHEHHYIEGSHRQGHTRAAR